MMPNSYPQCSFYNVFSMPFVDVPQLETYFLSIRRNLARGNLLCFLLRRDESNCSSSYAAELNLRETVWRHYLRALEWKAQPAVKLTVS